MDYAGFYFFEPVRFLTDIDDPFNSHDRKKIRVYHRADDFADMRASSAPKECSGKQTWSSSQRGRLCYTSSVLIIRDAQMAALAAVAEAGIRERAIAHLRNCIPEVCATLTEAELCEIVLWGRERSRHYGIEGEYDFFRYLNLMFMFGFEFDSDHRYPWAARTLNAVGRHPAAKIDLLMDHALLFCSTNKQEQTA